VESARRTEVRSCRQDDDGRPEACDGSPPGGGRPASANRGRTGWNRSGASGPRPTPTAPSPWPSPTGSEGSGPARPSANGAWPIGWTSGGDHHRPRAHDPGAGRVAPPRSHPAGLRLRRPRRHRPARRADLGRPEVTASGLAPNTVHKAYQVLSKAMAAAVDAGLLAITPCRNVPLPKLEHREMRFLSPTEIATLAAVVAPRYRALVLVGGYGGLRIGELAGLRRGGSTSCAPGSTWPRSVSRSGASSSPAGPRPGPGAGRYRSPARSPRNGPSISNGSWSPNPTRSSSPAPMAARSGGVSGGPALGASGR